MICSLDERLGVVAGKKELGHLLGFTVEAFIFRAEATQAKELGVGDTVFYARVVEGLEMEICVGICGFIIDGGLEVAMGQRDLDV